MATISTASIQDGQIIYAAHLLRVIQALDGNQAKTIIINGDFTQGALNNTTDGTTSFSQGSGSVASGPYSHAEGRITNATGDYAHSEGYDNTASGDYAHSEGDNTAAGGFASHAEGDSTSTSGDYAHSEGDSTQANGYASHAEGESTITSGIASHAEGFSTLANGDYSHAEGYQTVAAVFYSHAEGYQTLASGNQSHTEGYLTTASANGAHAEGRNTLASGLFSHAEGTGSISSGSYSHTEGELTIAFGDSSHAEGKWSWAKGIYSHAEGFSTETRGSGSHTEGYYTVTEGEYSHAEGNNSFAVGDYSHAEGGGTSTSGEAAHAEGYSTNANGDYSHAEGSNTVASGNYSHAEGTGTYAYGEASHAEGYNSYANSNYSHAGGRATRGGAFGFQSNDVGGTVAGKIYLNSGYGDIHTQFVKNQYVVLDDTNEDYWYGTIRLQISSSVYNGTNTIIGLYDTSIAGDTTIAYIGLQNNPNPSGANRNIGWHSHTEGFGSYTFGWHSHAEGEDTITIGEASHAEGNESLAIGYASHAEGGGSIAYGDSSHAEGGDSIASGSYSHAEGYGTFAFGSNSHAEGLFTSASGPNSHAEGATTKALGESSHAEGVFSWANAWGSHAEGFSTETRGEHSHTEGFYTLTSGSYSHAEGSNTVASGNYSHAEGNSTIAYADYQLAVGQYNTDLNTEDYFVVGVGTFSTRADGLGVNATRTYISNSLYLPNLTNTAQNRVATLDSSGKLYYAASESIRVTSASYAITASYALNGGGGTPALPNRSIQFNNNNVFGGSSDFVFDNNGNFIFNSSSYFNYANGNYAILLAGKGLTGSEYASGTSEGSSIFGQYNTTNDTLTTLVSNIFTVGNGDSAVSREDALVIGKDYNDSTSFIKLPQLTNNPTGYAVAFDPTSKKLSYSTISATPGGTSKSIQFNNAGVFAGATGFNYITGSSNVLQFTGSFTISSSLNVIGTSKITGSLAVSGSGSSVVSITGTTGPLLTVNDSNSGSLFTVNDISGMPVLDVRSDASITMGNSTSPSLNLTKKLITTASQAFALGGTLIPTSSYNAAFFEYVAYSASNARAGNISAVWNGTTIASSSTVTTDIGSTTGLTTFASISGSYIVLSGSANNADWTVKSIIRAI